MSPSSRWLLSVTACLLLITGYAQQKPQKKELPLIQLSGVVLDQDSLTAIPYVSIIVKGTRRGTVSDFYGFFSIVCSPGDELEFSSVTHKNRNYRVADTTSQKYSYVIQLLAKDTFQLQNVDVFPWPSREEFRRAFLALNLNESDAERADKNISRNELSYLERTQPTSPTENYKYVMQGYYTKIYTAGQQPQMSLLNPVAWAEFIDAWRRGKLGKNYNRKK
jgi:hypothetical protein